MYVLIEGLIGVGKTTVMRELRHILREQEVYWLFEPVHEFNDFMCGLHKPLTESYRDGNNFACAQMHIIDTLKEQFELIPSVYQLIVSERGLISPPVFIRARFQTGAISPFMRDWLLQYWESKLKRLAFSKFKPDLVIFLRNEVDVCIGNVKERGRPGELDFESMTHYMKCLEEQYSGFLESVSNHSIEVIEINLGQSFRKLSPRDIAKRIAVDMSSMGMLTKPE